MYLCFMIYSNLFDYILVTIVLFYLPNSDFFLINTSEEDVYNAN